MGDRPAKRLRMGGGLTVQEIAGDKLTATAKEKWGSEKVEFSREVVKEIYTQELNGNSDEAPSLRRVMVLEVSQYLEKYLWPNFDPEEAVYEEVMSAVLMVNEKFREGMPPWNCFDSKKDLFPSFFQSVLKLKDHDGMRMHEKTAYLMFMINSFQSLENEMVRSQVLKLVSLPLWHSLSSGRLKLELHAHPALSKRWSRLAKKESKQAKSNPAHVPITQKPEATLIPALLSMFLNALDSCLKPTTMDTDDGRDGGEAEELSGVDLGVVRFCERFVEFLVDLLSQLPTRRFVRTVLDDRAILVRCKMSDLYRRPEGSLFIQLVDHLDFYVNFNVDDHTGEPQTEEQVVASHYEKLTQLQRLAFRHWHSNVPELAFLHCAEVQKRATLWKLLSKLPGEGLHKLVTKQLKIVDPDDVAAQRVDFLKEVVVNKYEKRRLQREAVNAMPLYPMEAVLWDKNQVPTDHYTGEGCLALPKLNLQFLSFHDYLLRNFNLFRLEATYEIQEDIADVLGRMGATLDEDGNTKFRGWARMATPITAYKISQVQKPRIGEDKPASVLAEVTFDTTGLRGEIRSQWDDLKQHDVVFLLTVRPPEEEAAASMYSDGQEPDPRQKYGLAYVRGCEVIEVKDAEGKLMNDFTGRVKPDEWKPPKGFVRTLVVAMDAAQYQIDMNMMAERNCEDVYGSFNLLMRRKPKENNFKAVLESIRDLMNEECTVPEWLHDIFLGYGDPAAADYKNMEGCLDTIDFKDTFLDAQHVKESFPDRTVRFTSDAGSDVENPKPPFRVTFPPSEEKQTLQVQAYTPPDPGPYPQNQPAMNSVRFTPVQVEAIRSGVQPGLTMVVGPPGTGKTDTAVQIMHILYHNCPGQRTLLITHSNQALNDLFQKIMERDVPARYLLRLGMGEQDLDTDLDFSRVGRVNAMLARRLELLAEVEKMAKQVGAPEDMAYTCETAGHFWLLHVLSRWEKFVAQCDRSSSTTCVKDFFPFKEYFSDAPQPLFEGQSVEDDMEKARGCFRHLKTMFQELEECRAFELLKGQADRVNYLMTKQAKIVAMTCTHAALKRREFLSVGLKYDNLLMEESAQILEIESFIPMLLQKEEDGVSRLKRVILIGDHHQLPPVVKNTAFQKYSHLDQSLFTRFVRLGTPYIELDAQGRARPSLANLYNWRYRNLGDLPLVSDREEYKIANAGFAYDYQFIDVPDFEGKGESEPTPFFYQNLGEAEYIVRVYQFMRLLGYPARKISILTTYNGQKHLLRDVIERRCVGHPAFGRPYKVTTVDKYQGQQNDYILLSLVRTKAFGHLRDVRRLIVATSRSRLGLYAFGRQSLFSNCYELQPTFRQFMERPTQLELVKGEGFDTCKRKAGEPVDSNKMPGVEAMDALVQQMTWEWNASRQQN
ncbi:hypothetical protein BSKO_04748 [Bryopsis sp. KO-2023]|nr:hypothetical protein BSKO_04748 [Bryopsis sp. KO-2023]